MNPESEPDALSYMTSGVTYLMIDQYDEAISDFTEAIKLEPNDAESYGARGQVYKQLDQKNQAIQDFKKVLSLNTNLEWIRQELEEMR